MKKFKKSLLIVAVIVATMSLSYVSAFATKSPPPSAIIVDSSNPGIQPRTNFVVIDNANLNNGGSSWPQPSGYNYAGAFIANSTSQALTVYLSYDSSGSKQNIGTYTVNANSNLTINVTNAGGHIFYLDYSSANGVVSGTINVQANKSMLKEAIRPN